MEALILASLTGIIHALPNLLIVGMAVFYTANRQKNAAISAQELVNKRFEAQGDEINRLIRQIDDCSAELDQLRSSGPEKPDNPTNTELPLGSE